MAHPDAAKLARLHERVTLARETIQALCLSIAETEDRLADTLETTARHRPHDADRLRALANSARQYAEKERQRAASGEP